MNRLRSPTAEAVFAEYKQYSASSAGTNPDADTPVSADLIDWADIVFVMEGVHRQKLNRQFGSLLRAKPLFVLGIPDNYEFMDKEFVDLLKRRVSRHLSIDA